MSDSVLYITRNGLLEPLGQSQILPYLKGLSCGFSITLISFEKPSDWSDHQARAQAVQLCQAHGIRWIPLRFRARPRCWVVPFALLQLGLVALRIVSRTRRPVLVHARSYVPAGVALVLHRLTGNPFLFDMRALWPEELITAGHLRRGSLLHRALLWLERLALQEASGVVSLTHAALHHLQQQYPRQLQGQRLVVIPTCADLTRFHPSPPSASTAAPQLLIGCIGTVLSGWFRIDWLRGFFDAVARADPSARFELISRDAPGAILAALNPSPLWRDRLHLAAASPAQMPAIVGRHTASVMFFTGGLSKLGSSPTRLAEVLGCGRPVVANGDVGDMAPILRSHRVGVLASGPQPQQMDACWAELRQLLQEPDLSSRCRRTAEQLFSLESGTHSYQSLYHSILGQ